MKRISTLIVITVLATFLAGCGVSVEVPPAHVGKLSTESGLQEDVIRPSKFRLEWFCYNCDSLILAEASDYGVKESMLIYMPKDQLNLSVEVRGVFSISSDKQNVEQIFARVSADQLPEQSRVRIIPMTKVYSIYAQPVIREAIRSLLTKYTIAEVMENRDAISTELAQEVRERLAATT